MRELAGRNPLILLRYDGEPEDIAPPIAFRCRERARRITGRMIEVDAGRYF